MTYGRESVDGTILRNYFERELRKFRCDDTALETENGEIAANGTAFSARIQIYTGIYRRAATSLVAAAAASK